MKFEGCWGATLEGIEKYRLKALTCEKLARESTDEATQLAWEELAIEWHILASGVAQDDKVETG